MTDRYIQRKLGSQAVSYPAPGLEEVLEPTFGIIVYQEQVMLIAAALRATRSARRMCSGSDGEEGRGPHPRRAGALP